MARNTESQPAEETTPAETTEDGQNAGTTRDQAAEETTKPATVTEAAGTGTGQGTVHQDGAPEEMAKAADQAAEQGYLGSPAEKPDYSQANPSVMGRE